MVINSGLGGVWGPLGFSGVYKTGNLAHYKKLLYIIYTKNNAVGLSFSGGNMNDNFFSDQYPEGLPATVDVDKYQSYCTG